MCVLCYKRGKRVSKKAQTFPAKSRATGFLAWWANGINMWPPQTQGQITSHHCWHPIPTSSLLSTPSLT